VKIDIIEKKGNELIFTFEGPNEYLNALRRVCMSEIPVLAVTEIEFLKNDSAIYDEMLAHRIGLVPITTSLKITKKEKKEMVLNKKGPGYAYSGDIKSKNPEMKPAFDKMPLTLLENEQEVKAILTVDFGTGKEHTKFSPCLFIFRRYPQVKILEQEKGLVNVCPKKVFKKDKEIKIDSEKLRDCDLCELCIERYPKAVEVSGNDNKFVCYIESWGQIPPEEILKLGKKEFLSKLNSLSKAI